jgi:hypothetical protein
MFDFVGEASLITVALDFEGVGQMSGYQELLV